MKCWASRGGGMGTSFAPHIAFLRSATTPTLPQAQRTKRQRVSASSRTLMRSCRMHVGGPNMTHSSTPRLENRKPHKHCVQLKSHHVHPSPNHNLTGRRPNENLHRKPKPAQARG